MADKEGNDFSGFKGERDYELSLRLLQRKFASLEETVYETMNRLAKSESEQDELKNEIQSLKKELRKAYIMTSELEEENIELKKQLKKEAEEVKKCKDEIKNSVNKVQEQHTVWTKTQKENEVSMKKILENQQKANVDIKEKVVKVIKEKERLVRDTVDKVKCIVIFGVREDKETNRLERDLQEKEKVKGVLIEILEDDQTMNTVEEFHRIGKYQEGKDRPLKIKFVTQAKAEEVLRNAWKLAKKERFKRVWINKDMDREERDELKKLVEQMKQKNLERTEEEKEQFFYQVRDQKIRKRAIKK